MKRNGKFVIFAVRNDAVQSDHLTTVTVWTLVRLRGTEQTVLTLHAAVWMVTAPRGTVQHGSGTTWSTTETPVQRPAHPR